MNQNMLTFKWKVDKKQFCSNFKMREKEMCSAGYKESVQAA